MNRTRSVGAVAIVAAALAGALPLWADDDEPGRGVVRISVLNGDVSVRRGDSGDFVAAAVNAPLVVQDRILTGISSRAELQFDWANFLRISHNADVRLAELENARYLVQIARGTVTWRVLRDYDAYIEISTPSVSVRPVRKGIYRVTVTDDGAAEITVRTGEAEIFTPRGSERLKAGRTMFARGSASDPEVRVSPDIPDDDWDRWNVARDRDLERTGSYRYVSRDIYGADDLDHHGRWVQVPSYGWVWSPRVAVGWAPYRHGRWVWMDWYGWSWVSYDPWGWAPYHYGRWFHNGPYGWCWWPGSMSVRHRWSPGLVAFFGFGRASVGVGWGRVGWVPIGPHEPFYPWWGSRYYSGYRNRTHIDNSVTVVNNVNITNIYRNSRINDAVTIIDGDGFRRGRGAGRDYVRLNDVDLRSASMARGPVPLAPERESLRFADRDVRVNSGREQDRFFSNRRPPAVDRASFDEQQRGVEQIARRSFSDSTPSGGTRMSSSNEERRGWRAARTEPSSAAGAESPSQSETRADGWRRFGAPRNSSSRSSLAEESAAGEPSGVSRSDESGRREASAGADEWRRFGSARTEAGGRSSTRADAVGSGSEVGTSDGWRRFGAERSTRRESDASPSMPRSEVSTPSGESWRRLGGDGANRRSSSAGFDSRSAVDGTRENGRTESPDRQPDTRSERSGRADWGAGRRSEVSGDRQSESRSERSGGFDWGGRRSERNSNGSGRSEAATAGERIRISPPIVRERSDSGSGGSRSGGGTRMEGGGRAEGLGRSGDAGGRRR